jgi:hypothetical protein
MSFISCPIASRFIETREDALSYYAHKLVGDHRVDVGGVAMVVRFNAEEIHLFTDRRAPCPAGDVMARAGRSREIRCFSAQRARMLELVLPTIQAPAVAHEAKMEGGVKLFGPAARSAQRLCIIVASDREANVYFVRTAYPVSPKDFAAARSSGHAAPWPPK